MLLPVGPRQLFIAVKEAAFAEKLKQMTQKTIVEAVNKAVVGNADNYVYGKSGAQLRFIQNWMGTTKTDSFMTRIEQIRVNAFKDAGK